MFKVFRLVEKYWILIEMGMLGCKAIDNPIEQNVKLGEDHNSPLVEKGRY